MSKTAEEREAQENMREEIRGLAYSYYCEGNGDELDNWLRDEKAVKFYALPV